MYSAKITRANPAAFIILIDQSGSMEEKILFDHETTTKAEAVALTANRLISEIISRSSKEDGVRDYFHLALIGYSDDEAYSLIKDANSFHTISFLADMDVRRARHTHERIVPEDNRSVLAVSEQRMWVEPQARSNTPMYQALSKAYDLAQKWCSTPSRVDSYPPIIFNITDGEASDAAPETLLAIAEKIRSLATSDGNAMLINIHISSDERTMPVIFPSSPDELDDVKHARLLYDMSSPMPEPYAEKIIRLKGPGHSGPFRGMSYNCTPADLVSMIDIGSISIDLVR